MKRIIAIICLAGAALLYAHSGNIPLYGDLGGGGIVKNPVQTPQVEVYQDANGIEITFACNLGKLKITVTDQFDAVVFTQTVDTAANSSLPIDTGGWNAGTYTLTITDGQGNLEGIFVIN